MIIAGFQAGVAFAGLTCIVGTVGAQSPRLLAAPASLEPGSIVRLTLESPQRADAVSGVSGEMAGEPLHFFAADSGRWRAIAAVPVSAEGGSVVVARVTVRRASGTTDTVRARVTIPVVPPPPKVPLTVDTQFTRPLDAATLARITRENDSARQVGRSSHATPRLWTEPFLRPRTSIVTSGFGTGRAFNGKVSSRHLGVDFRGAVGDAVQAANRGVVALVDTFFLAGTVVYVDHGAGVVTGYFHLSEALVAVGDTVARGQTVARVGDSGRVTASHLHWMARYGSHTVNPLDLVALDRWYPGATGAP